MPNDTFKCHNRTRKIQVVFLTLQIWNSNACLKGSCSNVRAFTRHTYPVFSSPAQRTIKQYHAGTVFLNESSCHICSHLCIHSGESQQRKILLTAVGLLSVLHPTLTSSSCPSFSSEWAVSIFAFIVYLCFYCVYTTAKNRNFQQSSQDMAIREKILTATVLTVKNN